MKRVFRSIINIKKGSNLTIPMADLKNNYRAFKASKVDPEDPSFVKLWTWIEAHFRSFDEVPDWSLLYERAESDGDDVMMSSLRDIAQQVPYTGSDYRAVLKDKFEEQSKDRFQNVLTSTWKIASDGQKIKKKTVKGLSSAIEYLMGNIRSFRMGSTSGAKTESDILSHEDGKEVIQNYEKRKVDPMVGLGMYSHLTKIDDVVRGLKPGQLMIVGGFVGHGKSTMSVNLAYNGIIQGLNGLFVSMEMSFDEMRDSFYVMHTSNVEWYDVPKYRNLISKVDYKKVQYGELNDLEEEFFKAAAQDFSNPDNPKNYGRLYLYQPPEKLTPSTLETLVYDYHAQLQEQGRILDFVVVDYVGLMVADRGDRYGDFNTDLNNILKKFKNLALNFDNGRKLRVITPFQINRTGWKEAMKNDGVYNLAALSNANEAERSSDLIITVYMTDEMKKNGIIKVGCLKHRQGEFFSPFEARIDFASKQIRDFIQKSDPETDDLISDIPLD